MKRAKRSRRDTCLTSERRREVAGTTEANATGDVFDRQARLSKQEMAGGCQTLFGDIRVWRHTNRLAERALEMPRTDADRCRKRMKTNPLPERVVNVVECDS